ncbi:transporter [Phenylobacterium sp. LjRoot164]|uniref:transporter n=1 Tax=unclassified Phenylobacterium TaxID=2640670 RepID=UPI003ED120AC
MMRIAAFLAGLVLFLAGAAHAQDDGPRVYQLAPVGAQNVTAFLVNKRGNETPEPGSVVPGSKIDTDILVFRYARTFDVGGRPVTPFLILPTGSVRSSGAPKSSGFGDMQIGGTVGLIGSPALSPEAFADFKPGFGLGVLGRVYFPTGAYGHDKPVNLGANRIAYQVGLPTVFATGRSYREPGLTSLEVLPTLTFYEDNDDPFGAGRSAKDPLFSVEAHLTHSFSRRIWASADMLYRQGGETVTDGRPDANGAHGWSAGGSLALPFVASTSVIFTYQHVIERDDDGPDGWFFRTALVAPF